MSVWFVTIGAVGAYQISKNPAVLEALNPWYAVELLIKHREVSGF
jgi:KUP system potassium uptake protein